MNEDIKDSIIDIINEVVKALNERNSIRLRRLSNYSIHNASIFQDEDSVSMAVIIYSIAKIIERYRYNETAAWTKNYSDFARELVQAKNDLEKNNFEHYRIVIKGLFKEISKVDTKLRIYIEEVIAKSKIKKGSLIYEHGISLARAAEILGISQWELMNYVGKTTIVTRLDEAVSIKKRIERVREAVQKKIKAVTFDTGPIISLATNNLLWLLAPLKENFGGQFIISGRVKHELIDRPIRTRKFKLEALQVMEQIRAGSINVIDEPALKQKTNKLLEIANRCYKAKGSWIKIVHYAEMESLALALMHDSPILVIDERTTRMLIESPERLREILERKLHVKIQENKQNITRFAELTKKLTIIRSTELAIMAYELGLLDRYLP
ncbi:hypothetical protein KY339_03950, partial [Candidatus Woesearchaeota archaeon]|nr:hypothetical protein [Candidatus Woesearchaeota archaeon]